MQPGGVSVEGDASQLDPGRGSHQSVHCVRTISLPHAIGSTRSRCSVLKVEFDSHTDICVIGWHALIIYENPKVVMVSSFDPSQPAQKATVINEAIKYTQCHTGGPLILLIN